MSELFAWLAKCHVRSAEFGSHESGWGVVVFDCNAHSDIVFGATPEAAALAAVAWGKRSEAESSNTPEHLRERA